MSAIGFSEQRKRERERERIRSSGKASESGCVKPESSAGEIGRDTERLRLLSSQSVYNLLGETLSRLQQYAEAERWFQASLASQPDHVPAHITYGKLLARNVSSRASPRIIAVRCCDCVVTFHSLAQSLRDVTSLRALARCETVR